MEGFCSILCEHFGDSYILNTIVFLAYEWNKTTVYKLKNNRIFASNINVLNPWGEDS